MNFHVFIFYLYFKIVNDIFFDHSSFFLGAILCMGFQSPLVKVRFQEEKIIVIWFPALIDVIINRTFHLFNYFHNMITRQSIQTYSMAITNPTSDFIMIKDCIFEYLKLCWA